MLSMKQWTERLSRGEYDEHLYWECFAEDCELAGDWDAAQDAYRRVLDLPHVDDIYVMQAHGRLGGLHALWGDDARALPHFHAATQRMRRDAGGILYRHCASAEAALLLRMGRIRRARRLLDRAFASFEPEHGDILSYARLHALRADCRLELGDVAAAQADLDIARCALTRLSELHGDAAADGEGSGVHAAYSHWWHVEAKRRRHIEAGESELEAWEHSVDRARRAAVGWHSVHWDASILKALVRLAAAYDRHARSTDAAHARAQADALRCQWRLPHRAVAEPSPRRRWWHHLAEWVTKRGD
jgi:tetratricopeptide (TPR) repeat protein